MKKSETKLNLKALKELRRKYKKGTRNYTALSSAIKFIEFSTTWAVTDSGKQSFIDFTK